MQDNFSFFFMFMSLKKKLKKNNKLFKFFILITLIALDFYYDLFLLFLTFFYVNMFKSSLAHAVLMKKILGLEGQFPPPPPLSLLFHWQCQLKYNHE